MAEEFLPVLVPEGLVPRVLRLIAAYRPSASDPVESDLPSDVAQTTPDRTERDRRLAEWTDEIVDRMVRQSAPPMRQILKLLAERADRWVATGDLAKVLNHRQGSSPSSTVAGTLGAFGRRCTHRYKRYGITTLPWDRRWDSERHCRINRMPSEIAGKVLAALKKHSGD